ncbi:alpha/beta hydrolase family protein [Antrihabitans stalagmiti]|uniref:alpha/beta hydrolase family protein n=1 Tax=Antrihabitans stalagmiti TaxID=2799499 RepID=UPI001F323030|nr:alpha/beta family hydrolase [Antrihabitans stalagmiti]
MEPGRTRLRQLAIPTAAGEAQVWIDGRTNPRFLVVLTHGAAGGVDAPDLLAVRRKAVELGGSVARVLQPYRVAGGRAPGSAVRQDAAWLEIVADLRRRFKKVPLILGGRSNGARVACRTAPALGAAGVIALAFPLHPPGQPEKSRVEELRGAGTDVVVLNGDRDPFGVPDPADAALVHVLAGETHALKKSAAVIGEVVEPWLLRWSE